MALDNEYRAKDEKTQDEPTKKQSSSTSSATRKKKAPEKAVKSPITAIRERLNSKKTKTSVGVAILLLGFFIFLANFSYLFTWQEDQNRLINKGFFEFLFEPSAVPVANWLGKFGAWTSHLLIYRWFGISSFGIPFFLIIFSVKTLLNTELLPVRKTLSTVALSTVWFSIFLGYFAGQVNYLGGTFGYQINEWFTLTLGKFGSLILICSIGYLFALILFNFNLQKMINWFRKSDDDEEENQDEAAYLSEEDLAVVNTIKEEDKVEDRPSSYVDFSQDDNEYEEDFDSELIDELNDDEDFEEEDDDFELIKKEPIPVDTDDEDFSVNIMTDQDDDLLSEDEVNLKTEEFGEYDPKLDLSSYTLPPIDLLKEYKSNGPSVNKAELEANKNKIVDTLSNYKIEISKIMATVGPTVTL